MPTYSLKIKRGKLSEHCMSSTYLYRVNIVQEQMIQYLIVGVEAIADLIVFIKFVRKVIG